MDNHLIKYSETFPTSRINVCQSFVGGKAMQTRFHRR